MDKCRLIWLRNALKLATWKTAIFYNLYMFRGWIKKVTGK